MADIKEANLPVSESIANSDSIRAIINGQSSIIGFGKFKNFLPSGGTVVESNVVIQDILSNSYTVGDFLWISGYYEKGDLPPTQGQIQADTGQRIDNGIYHQFTDGNVLCIKMPYGDVLPSYWGINETSNTNGDTAVRINVMAEILYTDADFTYGYSVKFPNGTLKCERDVIWKLRKNQIVTIDGGGSIVRAGNNDMNIFTINGNYLPENWWKMNPDDANCGALLKAQLEAVDGNQTRVQDIYDILNATDHSVAGYELTWPSSFTTGQEQFGHPTIKNFRFIEGRNQLTIVGTYAGVTQGNIYELSKESGEKLIFCLMFKSQHNVARAQLKDAFLAIDGQTRYRFHDPTDTTTPKAPRIIGGYSQCNSTTYESCRVYSLDKAKSAFASVGNSSMRYSQCVSEGGRPNVHCISFGTNNTAYGVDYDGMHIENEAYHYGFLIYGNLKGSIRGLYQQFFNIIYSGTPLDLNFVWFPGKLEFPLSPCSAVKDSLISPPVDAVTGEVYLIWNGVDGATSSDFTATGDWAGHENEFATKTDTGYDFEEPFIRYSGDPHITKDESVSNSNWIDARNGFYEYDQDNKTWSKNVQSGRIAHTYEAVRENDYDIMAPSFWVGDRISTSAKASDRQWSGHTEKAYNLIRDAYTINDIYRHSDGNIHFQDKVSKNGFEKYSINGFANKYKSGTLELFNFGGYHANNTAYIKILTDLIQLAGTGCIIGKDGTPINLDITGDVTVKNGTEGLDKIATCDADGKIIWKTYAEISS